MIKEVYTVELERPYGVSVPEMRAYIEEAIRTWGGQRWPSDPLFYPWNPRYGKSKKSKAVIVKRRYP